MEAFASVVPRMGKWQSAVAYDAFAEEEGRSTHLGHLGRETRASKAADLLHTDLQGASSWNRHRVWPLLRQSPLHGRLDARV